MTPTGSHGARGTGHAVVVGAGIVGAACAEALDASGFRVTVLDAGSTGGGATAAGMGHVLLLDDTEAQFALTRRSRDLWDARAGEWPEAVERVACGTLWIAEDADELAVATDKAQWFAARGIRTELLEGADAVRAHEPELTDDLAGAMRLPEDSVIYAPTATDWMLRRIRERGAVLRDTPVVGVTRKPTGGAVVTVRDGTRHEADLVVVSAGHHSIQVLDPELRRGLPGMKVVPKKGHLAITDRRPGFLSHQVVELGYLKSAHGSVREAVACNIQPRPTGQLLVGSSRQLDVESRDVEPRMIARVLRRAQRFFPRLGSIPVLRTWVGFRPASPDNLPWIGPLPDAPEILLATGHEGWGMTAALATGEAIGQIARGAETTIDLTAFDPARAATEEVGLHG